MTHLKALFSALAMLFAALAFPAMAAEFPPRPAGPIYDGADLLPPADEAALDARLREFNRRTGNAVIVATVTSLDGQNIENYSRQLYETWGIGGAERDAGVLLLVAPSEREMRIEVGYGLTPYITDILSGRIIRNDITPRFKAGDMAGGINAGVDAMVTQLERSPEDAIAIAEAAKAAEKQRHANATPIVAGVAFWIFIIVLFTFMFARKHKGRGYRGRGGVAGDVASAVGQIILWEAVKAATGHKGGGWSGGGGGGFGGFGGGGGGGFGGFGGGMSGGGGASGSW
jgi:uncharacterized protein